MKAKTLFAALLAISHLCYAGGRGDLPTSEAHFALGTVCTITLYEQIRGFSFDDAFDVIDRIDWKMSVQKEGSEVWNVNRADGEMVVLSDETMFVVTEGLKYGSLSNGLFDITVQPLVDLWGIGTEGQRIPDDEEIQAALELVDYRNVTLDTAQSGVKLASPEMAIDLGGIAKGYAADVVKDSLISAGFTKGILNFGGNVLAFGAKANGDLWKVGVQDPLSERGDYLGIIEAEEGAVVTSGVYERFFERGGVRYHHILDTETGYPVDNGLLSVTIITPDGITADAFSTAVFAMGLNRGMTVVESTADMEAIFITTGKEIHTSTGIGDRFLLRDQSFTLIAD